MKDLSVIILAAGMGTRMKSSTAKVLHPLLGRPMVLHVIENVMELRPGKVVAVLGHQADRVREILPEGVVPALQKELLGTAHAAMAGLGKLGRSEATLLLVSGDAPLISGETLKGLVTAHKKARAGMTVLTADMDEPFGYGRVIRSKGGQVDSIVEEKDATPAERAIKEINTGTYCFDVDTLRKALGEVSADNKQKEFYLTDAASIINSRGGKVIAIKADNADEALGINSRLELARAEKTLRYRLNRALMESGVTMIDPEATYIEAGAVIGRDTVVHPGNHISGATVIGKGVTLYPGNIISDSTVKDGAVVKGYSVLNQACVDEGGQVGPFAHLRPGSRVGPAARVGNFVELKKTILGEGAKASHLSYLGDAVIGRDVNIGAGTITCNYDGYGKFPTVIEDGVFVGSDTQLVAPVRIGKDSIIAAGTTVTRDVPAGSLAISRSPQSNREGWAKEWRKRKNK
ncbi:MAG: bifunctional UDP-N-acetylglucosamine diphosphorylase/glucosamine-1-phosphate N-acetyltransferase GlmU [Nitrospirota bacterium]